MKKGFTLLELSIALIIMGALSVAAVNLLKATVERSQFENQSNTLFSAKNYLLNFAAQNKRLPSLTEFNAMNFTTNDGKPLFYYSEAALQTSVCSSYTVPFNVTDSNGINKGNIGFFLASYGINQNLQTTLVGNNITIPLWNTVVNGFGYDDVTSFVGLDQIQNSIECSKLNIINPSLHDGYEGSAYSETIIGDGGTGTYTFNLASSTAAGLVLSPSGSISWTSPIAGSYTVDITIASGTFPSLTKRFVLVINSSSNTNTNNGNGNTNTNNGNGNTNTNNGNGNGNGNGRNN